MSPVDHHLPHKAAISEQSSGKGTWSRIVNCLGFWFATLLVTLGLFLYLPQPLFAQDESTHDWRGNISCLTQYQTFNGVLFCTGSGPSGTTMYVIVADLQSDAVGFEYVLPNGATADNPQTETECRDPNVPAWGSNQAKGCNVPGKSGLYPRLFLDDAVSRAKEVRPGATLAAVINADYGAPNATHGPEGLMVVRGERLDGADRCDDDFNAALRPWLGLGDDIDPVTGTIPATIEQLQQDSTPLPDWLYTGIGGGPWLVQQGKVNPNADSCEAKGSGRRLDVLEPVTNCLNQNQEKTITPPKFEGYGDSCYATTHAASGLSQDGRWLFLVVSDLEATIKPTDLAKYMHTQLGAYNALKFDGGGSSKLWFDTATAPLVFEREPQRPLTNYLAVYTLDGEGIRLPLDALSVETVYYQVITGDEPVVFHFTVTNTGPLSWSPEDGIALQIEPANFLSPVVDTLPLTQLVLPGASATWTWQAPRGTVSLRRLRMVQHDQPFGDEFAAVVVTLPAGMEEKRQELEETLRKTIEEWKAQGQSKLDELLKELQRVVEREMKDLLQRLLSDLTAWLDQLAQDAQETCSSLGLALLAPGIALILRRRTSFP